MNDTIVENKKYFLSGGGGDFLQCVPFMLAKGQENNRYYVSTHLASAESIFSQLGINIEVIEYFKNINQNKIILAKYKILGATTPCPRSKYFYNNPFPAPLWHKFENNYPIIGVHLGGSEFSLRIQSQLSLPLKKLPSTLVEQITQNEVNCLLFGTKEEIDQLNIKQTNNLRFVCEENIAESLSYVQFCDYFIGSDSVFKTMSSMLKIPTMVWMGDYSDPFRDRVFTGPYVNDGVMKCYRYNDLNDACVDLGLQKTFDFFAFYAKNLPNQSMQHPMNT